MILVFSTLVGYSQTGLTAVMANSNGLIVRPTNVVLNTNSTEKFIPLYYHSIPISSDVWTVVTNTGSFGFRGSMYTQNFTTNAGNSAIAFVNSDPLIMISTSLANSFGNGDAYSISGSFGLREGQLGRIVFNGTSANSVLTNAGSAGLDRRGIAFEWQRVSNTNSIIEVRLVVRTSDTNVITTAWEQVVCNNLQDQFLVQTKGTNTFLYFQNTWGRGWTSTNISDTWTNPVVTVNGIPGGTQGAVANIAVVLVNTSNLASVGNIIIKEIAESRGVGP